MLQIVRARLSLSLSPTALRDLTCRLQARRYNSTKSSDLSARHIKRSGYASVFALVAATGIWWSTTGARDNVPRLGGKTIHLSYGSDSSKDEVTRMLSKAAYSYKVSTVAGVDRYDGVQLASSSPCEDRFTHGRLPSPWKNGMPWMVWAVFDGHAGWQTAALLEEKLVPFVHKSLAQVNPTDGDGASTELVQRTIMKAFVDLDDSIVKVIPDLAKSKEPLHEKMKKLAPAFAGSCALLSLYDPVSSRLHVACTGDSRAVLGQQSPDGTWEAVSLSVDQTGSNEEEIARLNREHPGEEDIAKDGRVLGLVVSRAFGDGRWKWSSELQTDLSRRFYGPSSLTPRYNILTPPYITAEPVITTTAIDRTKPSFMILATDGLWDNLTSKQAVDLVAIWLQSQTTGVKSVETEPKYEPFDFGAFSNGVPWNFVEERTTTQDDNAAVHLLRNFLGGNHHEMIAGRLAFTAPYSRKLRDDITVQVVFFNTPGLGGKR